MLDAARKESWDALVELEQTRRPLVSQCAEPDASLSPEIAEILREVMAIDAQVVALSEQARDAVGAELQGLQKGRKATDAYSTSSR